LDWGQHYFDYEVHSRPTDDAGRPVAIANGSVAMQNIPSSFNNLAVYVPVSDHGLFRHLPNGFQVHDIIGFEASAMETLNESMKGWWTTVTGGPPR
jgi:hypothetical protein